MSPKKPSKKGKKTKETAEEEKAGPSQMQVVASCDSTGVTVINEADGMHLEEGTVEVAYINISEGMMLDEIEAIEPSIIDDDGTRQSWEFEALEIEDETSLESEVYELHQMQPAPVDEPVDEEQAATANDFLAGKITFQDFITRVEGEDEAKEGDSSDDEDPIDSSKPPVKEPEHAPAEEVVTSKKGKSLKTNKPKIVESAIHPNSGEISVPKTSSSPRKGPPKPKKGVRIMKKLPGTLLGNF